MSQSPFEPGATVMEDVGVGPDVGGFEPPRTAVVGALYACAAVDGVYIPLSILPADAESTVIWRLIGLAQTFVLLHQW